MKISWSPKAKTEYEKILVYLDSEWGVQAVRKFIIQTNIVLSAISKNPKMFVASTKLKNVRKGFITKHNSLFYLIRARKNEIVLLTFWDNRQNPSKSNF
jgi:plasmid stabilization system protein ParE